MTVISELVHSPTEAIAVEISEALTDSSNPTMRMLPRTSGRVTIAESPRTAEARLRSSSASCLVLGPGISISNAPVADFFILVLVIPISFSGILVFKGEYFRVRHFLRFPPDGYRR